MSRWDMRREREEWEPTDRATRLMRRRTSEIEGVGGVWVQVPSPHVYSPSDMGDEDRAAHARRLELAREASAEKRAADRERREQLAAPTGQEPAPTVADAVRTVASRPPASQDELYARMVAHRNRCLARIGGRS